MEKLSSIGQFEWLRNRILSKSAPDRPVVHVCMTGCRAYGAASVRDALAEEVRHQGLSDTVEVRSTGCHGFCAKAPVIAIDPLGIQYQEVTPDDAGEIVALTLKKNQLIERLAYKDPKSKAPVYYLNQIPFYAKQEKRVLQRCGRIDPTRVEDYIAAGGYQAIVKALTKMNPEQVIEEVRAAGIGGRGGAGFPAEIYHLQW
jgi:NADH-quinone oxidoreductase subunit F